MALINYELWRDVAIDNCCQHALDDLQSLKRTINWSFSYEIANLQNVWRVMRILYVCGRKWGKGAHFEAALSFWESNIFQHSLQFHFLSLTVLESEVSVENDFAFQLSFFEALRRPILADMEELHRILSNTSLERISASHMEDLLVIIDFLLPLHGLIPDLKESIRFLKNLIGFVRLRGLEPKQMVDLLMHSLGALVDAAYFWALNKLGDYRYEDYENGSYKIVDRIQPLKSQVREIYVGVLQKALGLSESSSCSTLPPESQALLLTDFVDSLLFLLRQLFLRHTLDRLYHHLFYKMKQRLRFLRNTTIGEQDDKIDDFIGILICEAAVIVFSLFHVEEESSLGEKLEHLFLSFEEKFKLLKPDEEVPRYQLPSECPQTNLLGFIDSLLTNINSANLFEAADFLSNSKMYKLHTIPDGLAHLKSFLANEELQVLWSRVATVAYETEFVLDSLLVGDTHQSLIVPIGAIISEIEQIKTDALGISNNTGQVIEVQGTSKIDSKKPLAGKDLRFDDPNVGLDDESKHIIERLTRGSKKLDVVSVVGMAGLGKTTLVKKVYRDPFIMAHFRTRLWCTVSQGRDKRSLLLDILGKSVDEGKSEYELGDKLRRQLKGKRYLVILDDVWETKLWSGLRSYFPCDDDYESRILVTTRLEDVAVAFLNKDSQPHRLRFLNKDESWELFRRKMGFKEDCSPELRARGESISTCCRGLPLMIIVVAGILSNMEPSKWEEIEKSIKKGNVPTTAECEEIVELSYRHLPDYLKPCFLYFGAYKEDQEVRVRELFWLWIAEGFVEKTEKEHELEDVAKGYVTELLQRNLIMVARRGSRGQVTYCVLHDVLLDFCKRKCKHEHFLDSLRGHELVNFTPLPPRMVYRLFVMPERRFNAESTQLFPHLRTLLFHKNGEINWRIREGPQKYGILYNFCQSKLIRILALNRIFYFRFFPNAIPQHLGHLKYLALNIQIFSIVMPSSIGLLSNLETFIIDGGDEICLPYAVWNMKKLRHMKAYRWKFEWKLDGDNPNLLENLRTLSCIFIHNVQEMQELVKKFPDVRRLKCFLRFRTYQAETLALDLLSQLESLHISGHYPFRFRFPENLKKLTLTYLRLPWSEISAIDRLPNLEVLKLMMYSFIGETWHVGGEGTAFPKLRSLTLEWLDLEEWTVDSEDSFPCLERLVLEYCFKLKELPICFLAESATLQLIEINDCPEVADSVKNLEEMNTEYGNDYLKIVVG